MSNNNARTVTIRFSFATHVPYGESLYVCGSHPEFGKWAPAKAIPLTWVNGDVWTGEVTVPFTDVTTNAPTRIEYKYLIRRDNSTDVYWEYKQNRVLDFADLPTLTADRDVIELRDAWQGPLTTTDFVFNSAAFSKVIFRRNKTIPLPSPKEVGNEDENGVVVSLEVYNWRVHPADKMAITGSLTQLGSWAPSQTAETKGAVPMSDVQYPVWKTTLNIKPEDLPFQYKYLIQRENDAFGPLWENGDNRDLALPMVQPPTEETPNNNPPSQSTDSSPSTAETKDSPPKPELTATQINEAKELAAAKKAAARTRFVRIQERVPFRWGENRENFDWRGAGVAIPVFSLRSEKGLGVGEFLDIKLLVDFALKAGMNLVQLLPINDTSVELNWHDSYPYSSLSVFALHPIYINIPAVAPDMTAVIDQANAAAKELNANPNLLYEKVMNIKMRLLREIFAVKQKEFQTSPELAAFLKDNKWLKPYALFCCLRDKYKTSEYSTWPKYNTITPEEIDTLTAPDSEFYNDFLFWCFVQFHLDKQMLEAAEYATRKGVVIKGDLPIGVDRNSVDTWLEPRYFNMDTSTGAPPDYFSENGQNWGFPTYNWEEMAKDGYRWWRDRFRCLDKYFTAIRIDHVLGFFRIWQIPAHGVTGMMGHFHPSIPIWRSELESAGIWDIDKLCEPQVTWDLLRDRFGADAEAVGKRFFDDWGHGTLRFKDEYRTEKAILKACTDESTGKVVDADLKNNLFFLLSNVCLFKDERDPYHKFYPRFKLFATPLYHTLPDGWKEALYRLHNSYFYERQEDLWRKIGLERLGVAKTFSSMLICAEDLGLVPACVPPVLHELGILGLRIQRMPQDPKKEFDTPWDYPYLTVCTPSCHDTSTTRGWWEADRARAGRYYNQILKMSGAAPYYCEGYVIRRVIEDHLRSKSMWAIFPIQELFALVPDLRRENPHDEQINDPANRYHEWKYRMHVTLEHLLNDKTDFTDYIKEMVLSSGRKIIYE